MFIADNFDLNQMIQPDSSFAFDGNDSDGCDLTNLDDDAQFLGKVRREKSCPNPMGQSEKPSDSGKGDPFDFGQFAESQVFRIFPKFVEICPTYIFGTSNTPVCKDISNGEIIRIPGVLPVTLLNVGPSTSCFSFFLFFFLLLALSYDLQNLFW